MCDNQSSIRLVHNPVHHNRSKHIQIHYHFIGEKQEEGEIDIVYVTTTHQFTDIFTKPLPIPQFLFLRSRFGIQDSFFS